MFARARSTYTKDGGGGQGWYSSSQHIHLKKINTINKYIKSLSKKVSININ